MSDEQGLLGKWRQVAEYCDNAGLHAHAEVWYISADELDAALREIFGGKKC
jgi:hypothetical protein